MAVSSLQAAVLCLFFVLVFYRIGAANLEGLMNYPFWRDMGPMMTPENFIKLRADHLWKVFPLLVIPFGAEVLATIALVFVVPPLVPLWLILAVLALEFVAVVSTVGIQVPIQVRHNRQGYDRASFDRLIVTDLWLRKVPSLLQAILVVWTLWLVVAR